MKNSVAKFLSFFVAVFILSAACVSPRYYDYSQRTKISQPMIDGEIYAFDQTVELRINVPQAKDGKLEISAEEFDSSSNFLKRRFYNRSVVFKTKGFEPYETELKNRITNEKWASNRDSGLLLLVPIHTAMAIGMPIPLMAEEMNPILAVPAGIGVSIIALVPALVIDAYNILIAAPSVLIVNPWFEYENLDMSRVVLLPTDELRQKCLKEGIFISNMGCVECVDKAALVADEKECLKCMNRIYEDGICRLRVVKR